MPPTWPAGMLAAMGEGVIVQVATGRIVTANAAAARMLGRDERDLLGRRLADLDLHLVRPDGMPLPERDPPWLRTLQTGVAHPAVVVGIHDADRAERRWLQITTALIEPGSEDLARAAVSTLTDITAVWSSAEHARAVVAAAGAGMLVVDRELRIRSANAAAAAIVGIEPATLVGAPMAGFGFDVFDESGDIIPDERWPASVTLSTGRSQRGVVFGVARPGEDPVWITASSEPLSHGDDGHPGAVVVTFTDITERQEREQNLRLSERRYRSLFGYHADAIVRMSAAGRLLAASPSVWRVLRFDPDDFPDLTSHIHPDDVHGALQAFQRMVTGEVGVRFTARIRRGDGRWIWADVTGGPVYDDVGALLEVQLSIREVGDRDHQARDLSAAQRVMALIAQGAATDDALSVLVHQAYAALPADSVSLVRFTDTGEQGVARHPPPAHDAHPDDLTRPGNDAAEALGRGIAAGVRWMRPMAGPTRPATGGTPKGMTVAVPVVMAQTLWGCLWAGLVEGEFAEGAIERLRAYADLAAVAVRAGGDPGQGAGL